MQLHDPTSTNSQQLSADTQKRQFGYLVAVPNVSGGYKAQIYSLKN
jgi:hypothetical protein